jgi:hypothetical protein
MMCLYVWPSWINYHSGLDTWNYSRLRGYSLRFRENHWQEIPGHHEATQKQAKRPGFLAYGSTSNRIIVTFCSNHYCCLFKVVGFMH